ncbi:MULTISPECIES: hypothetical protein [Flavobacterium]|uniref:Uncharacterized protein n=1 Tax=Flavobacterium johnsoniae (strain ATCC 17061 / DSM 2064 / JCM 8514 / BCRC 14874 / CCUG 350202 / NBRC 14942 / NCIMB 11054 / UW101) TaxID=376686 RepID=A5FFM1_FLAJ1|nr:MULTISPECIES: hypothetical protein [Flavobacterium]ABQ05997.1 hypothetical protein Fjoh_2976 [Flavobacterium johnsoniae UW101]EJG02254.1 hypothetical protein FF52_06225 [Flavobacterium sp. F52]OXG00633.1 hypothetical protein B0A63_08970 [Flavobacterium johnsoniae UW101]RXM45560.1 hypothetical protein BOW57_05530 [Flavobacterium sp. YO64]WJS93541.1 hypothetical protein NYQ10_15730 [Flavobacterium johnsoniae]
MVFTAVNLKKHLGKTLPQILFADLDYFIWAYENNVFRNPPLKLEAEYIFKRIKNIKIPKENPEEYEVEYLIHQPTGKFGHFELVPKTTPLHKGGSPAFRTENIDLTVARSIAAYDKSGCRTMIEYLKKYYFGDSSYKMVKKRCEDFFNKDSNFVLL